MNAEPPSRIPPKGVTPETKAAREEIASKGKVEKVREVDADELRKRKFLKYYEEEPEEPEETRPSPFDLYSGKKAPIDSAEGPSRSELDAEDAIVASPSYTPPPNLPSLEAGEEEASDEATTGALPQSEDFWEGVDFPPDQPVPSKLLEEMPTHKGELKGEAKAAGKAPPKEEAGKKKEPSPFGPPGKALSAPLKPEKKGVPAEGAKPQKKLPSPFEEIAAPPPLKKPAKKRGGPSPSLKEEIGAPPKERALEKEEERYLGRAGAPLKEEKRRERVKEEGAMSREAQSLPMRPEEKEREGERRGGKREQKVVEIESPSLPTLPAHIQPMAAGAAAQAAPYIHPSTVALFYQMVGTMYIMIAPPGIARTEIVLNNPSYANSKFFGSTIRIEKYATAPDSFNITLTGSDEAVTTFKENIPSLMTAFQNGNFTFRVNRLDVEYTIERPVFRRKERGEGGEAGSGGLGEKKR